MSAMNTDHLYAPVGEAEMAEKIREVKARELNAERKSEILRLRNHDAVIYEPDVGRVFCMQVLAEIRKEQPPVCRIYRFEDYRK